MGSLAWDLWFGTFGLGSLAGVFGLRSLTWNLWLEIFGSGSWAWRSQAWGILEMRPGESAQRRRGNRPGRPAATAL